MNIRFAEEKDYQQLADMKWQHALEDDADYGEHNLNGVEQDAFFRQFLDFMKADPGYKVFVAEEEGKLLSAMFVYVVPKVPKPNGSSNSIAYLTNVFTWKEYRSQGIGSRLLAHIKEYLTAQKCELLFVWPSDRSVRWYERNQFYRENDIHQCDLMDE